MLTGVTGHMRVAIVGLLVLIGVLSGLTLAAEGPPAALAEPVTPLPVAQQPPLPPVSTIPPFSTIPPLSPTPTAIRPTPPPAPSLAPTRAVPVIPTPIPPRPIATVPASSPPTPRAGGVPMGAALLLLGGSVAALAGGLGLLARSRR